MLQILDDDRLLNKINPADVHEVEQTLENAIRAGLSWDKLERASIEVAYTGIDARGKLPREPFPVRPPAGTRRPALAAEAARAVR